MSNVLEHGDGKMKTTLSIFVGCIAVFLLSWIVIFGIGGAVGIAMGVTLAVLSLVLGIVTGTMTTFLYIDWIDKG